MQAKINLDADTIGQLGITIEQFQEAVSNALSNLSHPETGDPLYFNNVRVMVFADQTDSRQQAKHRIET